MKVIDFEKKGQTVRLYLGEDDLTDWYGDDWDDAPYEHNAGRVYNEFIAGYTDMVFDFDDAIAEPKDEWRYQHNSPFSKDMMRQRLVPCIIVLPKALVEAQDIYIQSEEYTFWVGWDGAIKIYFGDHMDPQYIKAGEDEHGRIIWQPYKKE